MKNFKTILFYSLLLFCNSVYAEPLRVVHDPFAQPVLHKPNPANNIKLSSKTQTQYLTAKLSSTLRAGKNSMAIVDGQIVKLGEELDGYRLVKVAERYAIFLKNKLRTRLSLDDFE